MQLATLNQQQTMSSREIADLLGKQHTNIKISADRLAAKGVIAPQETPYIDPQNKQTYHEYHLTKRDSLILVAQNCPEFTAVIVDRWQELEAKQPPVFEIPTTLSGALRLAAEQAEVIEQQQAQLLLAAPAVAFVDRYVEAKSAKNLSDVAKILGWNPQAFIARLAEEKIIFKRSGSWVPFQQHIDCGRFTVKTGESNGHAFCQTRVEPKGIEWLASKFG